MKEQHRSAHFAVRARIDRAHATPARVAIDRKRLVVTIWRARARKRYRIPLETMVELAMARLMREEAERRLGVARAV